MITAAGTNAGEPLVHSQTNAPPFGAGPARVTVPVAEPPLDTLAGLTETEASVMGGATVNVVVTLCPFRNAVIVLTCGLPTISV